MFKVTSFYKFFSIKKNHLEECRKELLKTARSLNIRGLVLIGKEGLNVTLCGKEKQLEDCKKYISHLFKESFFWKDSYCEKWNFKRLSVKIKKEIINAGANCAWPKGKNGHISPKEWEHKLKSKVQILDVRNTYEVEIGRFQGSKNLNINSFQDFSKKLGNLNMDKNKETLIYCTGGIRCEKAIEIVKSKGFKTVYQLEGGILNYLKEFPDSHFKQECFVFDHRVALDQNLQASKKYALCPHCGQAGDLHISCKYCGQSRVICKHCKKKSFHYETCSKNCAYHFQSGHKCRKKHIKPNSLIGSS